MNEIGVGGVGGVVRIDGKVSLGGDKPLHCEDESTDGSQHRLLWGRPPYCKWLTRGISILLASLFIWRTD